MFLIKTRYRYRRRYRQPQNLIPVKGRQMCRRRLLLPFSSDEASKPFKHSAASTAHQTQDDKYGMDEWRPCVYRCFTKCTVKIDPKIRFPSAYFKTWNMLPDLWLHFRLANYFLSSTAPPLPSTLSSMLSSALSSIFPFSLPFSHHCCTAPRDLVKFRILKIVVQSTVKLRGAQVEELQGSKVLGALTGDWWHGS